MRAVVQRTTGSRVLVNNQEIARIDKGLMVLLGIGKGDSSRDADYLMDKIINLRIFPDENDKMNLSLLDISGEILLVSQFTLYGDTRKGRRPSFSEAELPDAALPLFEYCTAQLQQAGVNVQTGEFGASMIVEISNDGPCTILLDSARQF
ncbi:MAG: D-aminoacyl-tRNA deacylase [Syntrophomonadaceae bacterium]|nr:D-aminoacyl-tRNA deacylase [Syntrophomonadaceae bacterium]MDD3271471.1 D-aminoacyl-tRNA deacylase [Syntrophomonadaceae bacterium]MDD3898114.1 D-aminoacyl-tRNA deacylase [Syntrophomonadaceae bacterium]MDD4562467.1 D-aminoacyl-tRNA deacylase [Syntrophomonadaceae bacterium]